MVSGGEGRSGPPLPRGSDRSAANPIAASFSHARVDRHRRALDRRPREELPVVGDEPLRRAALRVVGVVAPERLRVTRPPPKQLRRVVAHAAQRLEDQEEDRRLPVDDRVAIVPFLLLDVALTRLVVERPVARLFAGSARTVNGLLFIKP